MAIRGGGERVSKGIKLQDGRFSYGQILREGYKRETFEMPLQDCEIVRIIFIRDNSRKVSSYFTFHDKTRVNYTIISDLGPETYALTRRCPSRWAPQPCPSPPPPQALRIYISVWITLDYQYGRHERRTRGNRASDS